MTCSYHFDGTTLSYTFKNFKPSENLESHVLEAIKTWIVDKGVKLTKVPEENKIEVISYEVSGCEFRMEGKTIFAIAQINMVKAFVNSTYCADNIFLS